MSTEQKTEVKVKKGDKYTAPTRRKFYNSPVRMKKIKKGVEDFKRVKGRKPNASEVSAIAYFTLPPERDSK